MRGEGALTEVTCFVVLSGSRTTAGRAFVVLVAIGARGLCFVRVIGTAFLAWTACFDWLAAVDSNSLDLATGAFVGSAVFRTIFLAANFSSALYPGGEFSFPPPLPIISRAGAFMLLASIWPRGTRRGAVARAIRGLFVCTLLCLSSDEGGLCAMQSSSDCGWYVGSWKVSSNLCVVFAPGWIVIMVVSSDGTYIVRRLESLWAASVVRFSSPPCTCNLATSPLDALTGAMLALPWLVPPIGTLFVGFLPKSMPRRAGSPLLSAPWASSSSATSSYTFGPISLFAGLLGRACANSR
jgi:hypothetical protein